MIDTSWDRTKNRFFRCFCQRDRNEAYSKWFRAANCFMVKKRFKSKISKIYFENFQKSFDKYIRKCVNKFEFKSTIYQIDKTKILFALRYLFHAIFNDWHEHRKNVDIDAYIWNNYVSFLQKHFKSLHIKIAKIYPRLKYAKQRFHQIVNEIISYVKKLKIQFFECSKKYQKYSNFFMRCIYICEKRCWEIVSRFSQKKSWKNWFDDLNIQRLFSKRTKNFENLTWKE